MAYTQTFFDINFFKTLLADLLVLLLATFGIPRYLDRRKRPKLSFVNLKTYNHLFVLTKAADGFWEGTLDFAIANNGIMSQREWFWHMYIPLDLDPKFSYQGSDNRMCQQEVVEIGGNKWIHFYSKSHPDDVVFPGSKTKMNFFIKVKSSEASVLSRLIYYYFNAEFGSSPPGAVDEKDFSFKKMGMLIVTDENLGCATIPTQQKNA